MTNTDKPLDAGTVQQYISQNLPGWFLSQKNTLVKTFKFPNFVEAIGFVNLVAALAEQHNHHPDISIHYNRVTLELWTHSVNGITDKDLRLASQIESLIK